MTLGDFTIPENEDISNEMTVHDKRYAAYFYQFPEGESLEQMQASVMEEIKGKYTPEQLDSLITHEALSEIISSSFEKRMEALRNKPVWFMISEFYGKYYIIMYYDNEYNRANGEDL